MTTITFYLNAAVYYLWLIVSAPDLDSRVRWAMAKSRTEL